MIEYFCAIRNLVPNFSNSAITHSDIHGTPVSTAI